MRWTALGSVLAVSASLLGGAVFAAPAHAVANTIVSLTFDDGNADQIAAANTLKAAGLRGTFFVPSGYLDADTYMTVAEALALQNDGHEIGGHSVTHADLQAAGADEAKRQVCNDRVNLTNMGFDVRNFAYPFASANDAVKAIVRDCGYNSARGLGDVLNKNPESAGFPVAESIPPADLYYTGAPDQVDNTWTLADLQNVVTQSVNGGGGWIQLTFHHIGSATDPLNVSSAVFAEYTTWLKNEVAAGRIEVKTVRDVIPGATKPAVAGPAVPPQITTGNLLANPGLETTGSLPGVPKCWFYGGFGTNTPTFTQVPGRTGGFAQQLTMAGYVSGDAKLLPTHDLGECAPSAKAGRTYQMSAWYTSSAPTQFEVYYRTGLGTWSYWTSSPFFNAATDWTQTTFTTPPLPAGATAISMGLNLTSDGTLTTDDYELTGAPYAPPAVSPFTDIATNQLFYKEMSWLSVLGISTGWTEANGTRTYRALQPVNRDAMAAFLYRAAGSPNYTPPAVSPFADISTSQLFYKEISWLASRGISTGWVEANGTRTYRALQPVNRDAMAAFLYRAGGSPAYSAPAASPFADIATNQLFYKEMSWLSAQGISTGWTEANGTRTYRALQPVARDAMAAFLYRAAGTP
ncbi:polysaccharide deacetylase family protein [Arthrobacter agilis]|uniref:polysaccharide deacetylase family protein n=1 Tax=Arthrobacter agilis TaxID=37921 RepID=UPI0027D91A35|nr:polysaccharide deacetylase family protein [Arthrobacter agilis]